MNTIGVSCPDFGKTPFPEMHDSLSKHFSHWEIFSELAHYAPTVCSEHREIISSSPMTFTVHTGIADINVASTNERIREASVTNIVREMEAARKLGIDTVTVHPGIINLAVKNIRGRCIEQAQKSMKEIEASAEEYGIHACIENMPNFPVMLGIQADELAEIVEGTDLPICFDIGHANTAGQVDRMVELFGDRIRNVHIHDNLGEKDDHMTIGDGNVDFGHVLELLKSYRHRYIIECKTLESGVESLSRLKKMLAQ